MSYCRWSTSDIYLYPNQEEKCITCYQCQLDEENPTNINFFTREEAIAHVEKHLAFGDNIPEYVLERLKTELTAEGNFVGIIYECAK